MHEEIKNKRQTEPQVTELPARTKANKSSRKNLQHSISYVNDIQHLIIFRHDKVRKGDTLPEGKSSNINTVSEITLMMELAVKDIKIPTISTH